MDGALLLDPPLTRTDTTKILLGMPHLARGGLSESWLLKDLGHRHWLLLAKAAGRDVPDFRDERGAPVYAAFCAVTIDDGNFSAAGENDGLIITSSLARLSRSQISSCHHLNLDDGTIIGTVTLISTFVRRTGRGGNHTIARVVLDGLPPVNSNAPAAALASLAADFRAGRMIDYMGLDLAADSGCIAQFDPCPSLDFNGAGLLYFTSFIALAERTEWRFTRALGLNSTVTSRHAFFYGNADPGEQIRVHLRGRRRDGLAEVHHCQISRISDQAVIADIFTRKQVGR